MKNIFKSILLTFLMVPAFVQSAGAGNWFTRTFVGRITNLESHKEMCELRTKLHNKYELSSSFGTQSRKTAIDKIATVLTYDQMGLGINNDGIFNDMKDVPAHPSNCDVIFNFATHDWYRINDKNVAYRGSFLKTKSSSETDLVSFNLSDVITQNPTISPLVTGLVTGCAVGGIAKALSCEKTVMAAAGITGALLATWGLSKGRSVMIENAKKTTFTQQKIKNFLETRPEFDSIH